MITVCSKCRQEYPINESLFGSKVECEACNYKWIVQDLSIEYPPLTDIPDYTVIDLETTGFSLTKDRIVEVAAQKVRNHEVVDSFESLVFPGCPIAQAASKITGIRQATVKDAPMWHEIADKLAEFVNGEILIGHNIIEFDSQFLNDGFTRVMRNPPEFELVDTLEIAQNLLPNCKNHKLETLTALFNIQTTHHRAMVDVISTRTVFENLLKIAAKTKTDLYDYFPYPVMKPYKTTFDETNPLYKKNIVLTGEFNRLVREDAITIIENMGGYYKNAVTTTTDILIICDNESNGGKLKKATELKAKGQNIKAMQGSDFMRLYTLQNKNKTHLPPLSRLMKLQEEKTFYQPKENKHRVGSFNISTSNRSTSLQS